MKKIYILLTLILLAAVLSAQDKVEPEKQVSNFATEVDNQNSITLSWDRVTGSPTADGYLIKASNTGYGSIIYPADKTPESDELEIGESSGAVNLPYATQSYQWTGLAPETTYYFKIFSYTNSGNAINYKLDSPDQTNPDGDDTPVPQASATTYDDPLPVTLSAFSIDYQSSMPTLSWTTQSEQNNMGWNVYRSQTADWQQAILVNQSQVIEGAGTTSFPTNYTYIDPLQTQVNQLYWYWIESIDYGGTTELHGPVIITIPYNNPNGSFGSVPQNFGVVQNYPNPFNPSTEICFVMEKNCRVTLTIYDIRGAKVTTLLSDQSVIKNNMVRLVWNGTDHYGKQVATGVYFAHLTNGAETTIRRMLMKK